MDSLKRKCAYCGDSENLSREHIFPGSIIKRFQKELITINDKSDVPFKSDLVIRDVCTTCNNGVLSELDSHFCTLFDRYMHPAIPPGQEAELSFEYNLLLRFLLKVSYNSARASSDGVKAVKALEKFVPYILGNTNVAPDVMLRLQIVTSAKKFNPVTQEIEGMIEASLLRSCKIPYDGPQKSNFIIRLVAFNSFWFYLILPNKKVNRSKKKAVLAGFQVWAIQPGVPVSPIQTLLKIPVEKTTCIHPSLLSGMIRKLPNTGIN